MKGPEKVQIITTVQNDACDSSDKDFNGFCYQQAGHSALAHFSVLSVNLGFKRE
jgi:hypothetical protein